MRSFECETQLLTSKMKKKPDEEYKTTQDKEGATKNPKVAAAVLNNESC